MTIKTTERTLEPEEVVRDGDIIHYSDGEARRADRFLNLRLVGRAVSEIKKKHINTLFGGWSVSHITRTESTETIDDEAPKKDRVSRKEYKKRIKLAIEYVDNTPSIWRSEVFRILEILRGEE